MTRVNTFTVTTDDEAINMSLALMHRGDTVLLYKFKDAEMLRPFWLVVASYRFKVN